jgi:hypothetical protein
MFMTECRHFRALWSRFRFKELDEAEIARLRRHLGNCRQCRNYDRQMQAVVDCLKDLGRSGQHDLESVRAGFLLEKAYQRSRMAARSRQAMAATLLAGFVGGILFWAAIGGVRNESSYPEISHTRTILLPVDGVKNISLAIDSDRALAEVTFTVELPDGIELDGYPGQRRLSWQGPLLEGWNSLTLPLLTHRLAREGVLKARIEYAGGGRELLLPLKPDGNSAMLPNRNLLPEKPVHRATWRFMS